MKHPPNNSDPLVRIGQGEYAHDLMPGDFEVTGPRSRLVGMILIALFYFILGTLLGAWLW